MLNVIFDPPWETLAAVLVHLHDLHDAKYDTLPPGAMGGVAIVFRAGR
jgi:hypothetical protein